jgi:hypothetical protein
MGGVSPTPYLTVVSYWPAVVGNRQPANSEAQPPPPAPPAPAPPAPPAPAPPAPAPPAPAPPAPAAPAAPAPPAPAAPALPAPLVPPAAPESLPPPPASLPLPGWQSAALADWPVVEAEVRFAGGQSAAELLPEAPLPSALFVAPDELVLGELVLGEVTLGEELDEELPVCAFAPYDIANSALAVANARYLSFMRGLLRNISVGLRANAQALPSNRRSNRPRLATTAPARPAGSPRPPAPARSPAGSAADRPAW